mmetsp:Transcript_11618/g.27970  ORF Transcript_11618/g.27970 Transcript_11618/m.27970 type:complete len:143 (+) Transcript_11618:58-486(+)
MYSLSVSPAPQRLMKIQTEHTIIATRSQKNTHHIMRFQHSHIHTQHRPAATQQMSPSCILSLMPPLPLPKVVPRLPRRRMMDLPLRRADRDIALEGVKAQSQRLRVKKGRQKDAEKAAHADAECHARQAGRVVGICQEGGHQ